MERRLRFTNGFLCNRVLALLVVTLLSLSTFTIQAQVTIAQDNASNYGSWTNGSNEGNGFGDWNITTGGNAGHFLGNPSNAGISGMDNPSFGLWANPFGSGNFVNVNRTFLQPLQIGHTFSFQWGVNWDSDGGGNKGFNLYTGGVGETQLININMGGSQAITINGANMFTEYGTQAMTIYFEVVSSTQLRVYALGRDGVESFNETYAISGLPDAFRFYASDLAADDQRQPYFNNLLVTAPDYLISWVNLQFPEGGTLMPGDTEFLIYARVEVPGITYQTNGSPQITAWIGFSDENTDPADWVESNWHTAGFNIKVGGQDRHEYQINAASLTFAPGTYYYASRFQLGDTGPFVYGGIDDGPDENRGGFWEEENNISGALRFGKNSAQTGNWSETTTWQGGVVPVPGEHVFILPTHLVTLNVNAQVNSLTIETGATLTVADDQTLTIGPNGTFANNGTFNAANSTIILNGTSGTGGITVTEYENITVDGINVDLVFGVTKINGILDLRSGSILGAPEFRVGSTLRYSQSGAYERVTEWNNPWNVEVTNGTLLDLNIDVFGNNLVVLGNLTIDNESSVTVDDGHAFNFIVNGNVILDGTLTLSSTPGSDLFVGGDWIRGATGIFNPFNRLVTFNGTSPQTLTGHTTFNYLTVASGAELKLNDGVAMNLFGSEIEAPFVVETGGILDVNTQLVDGDGSFTLQSGATLRIGSLDGIVLAPGDEGNIRTTTRNFSNEGIYHYIGSGVQYSGNALPFASASKVVIVELSNDESQFRINTSDGIVISSGGRFEIRRGTVVESTAFSEGRSVSGNGDLVMTGGVYRFERTTVISGQTFPRLIGNYSLTGGTIELAGETDTDNRYQRLRGGETYHNVLIAGVSTNGGYKFHSSAATVNNRFEIIENNIFDARNSALSGSADLVMNSGLLRISKVTLTQPELTGEYILTGGSVELYGTTSTQSHSLRGGMTYNNVLINAQGMNLGQNGNVLISSTITVNGVMDVNSPACLQVAGNFAVQGPGVFNLHNFAALRYGNANGITATSNLGNIRTSTRSFSSLATYVLIGASNPQVTGDGLPSTVFRLVLDKGSSEYNVELSQDLQINEELVFNRGKLNTGIHDLFISSIAPLSVREGFDNSEFNNSWVVGPLRRAIANTNTYIFPIGRLTGVQTATVNITDLDSSGSPTLTARFFENGDIPGNFYGNLPQTFGGIFINTLSQEGFWQIDANDDITAVTYDLSLFARGFGFINDPDGIRILKRPTGDVDWEMAGTHAPYSVTDPDYVFNQINITGFSDFAIGGNYQNNPLPVEWLSFDAAFAGGEVLLTWQTATEINNDYFTVLRSANGVDFEPLGHISGAGNSNQLLGYSFTDVAPLAGINYYQLRQTDFDGQTNYSRLLAVNADVPADARIFAHNSRIHFHLPHSTGHDWQYRIYSLQGNLISSGQIPAMEGGNHFALDAARWKGELLMVTLTGSNGVVSSKVLVR